MTIDLVMGAVSALIGAALLARNAQLAALIKEGSLATDAGRVAAFRAWLLVSAAGFVVVGAALVARGALGL